jgi:ATP-binding cassette, subfamily F, member 3
MALIKAANIKFHYEDQMETLFDDLNFEVNVNSRIGLIGKNGCGKSTLFSLISREYLPLSGNLYLKPDLQTGKIAQEIKISIDQTAWHFLWEQNPRLLDLKLKMEDPEQYSAEEIVKHISEFDLLGGYSFDVNFQKIMSQFGLDESFLTRKVETLSGGEKTKLAFARVMLADPDILLLDEPTNHMDVETLRWLEKYLINISIPYIVISHDRKFLDNCVSEIWEIENGKILKFSGNYTFYKEKKENEFKLKLHQYTNAKKRIKKLHKAVTDRKTWAKSHQAQTGKEGFAPVYETITNSAKDAMRRAKAIETRLGKEIEKAEEEKPWIEKKREIHFSETGLKVHTILKVEDLAKSFGNKQILRDINFSVRPGERVLVSGKNGSGKSTLLKILTGKISDYDGRFYWSPQAGIGYYSQELEELDPDKNIIEELSEGDKTKEENIRTILGSLNLRKDKVFQKIADLSIGEKSKVALTRVIISEADVLVLDEPTNHLEIAARESLEEALKNFNGAVILVSHDRYLCEKITTRDINLDR